jgi:hypothetical protein
LDDARCVAPNARGRALARGGADLAGQLAFDQFLQRRKLFELYYASQVSAELNRQDARQGRTGRLSGGHRAAFSGRWPIITSRRSGALCAFVEDKRPRVPTVLAVGVHVDLGTSS